MFETKASNLTELFFSTRCNSSYVTVSRLSHWNYFSNSEMDLFKKPIDKDNSPIKFYQDLMVFSFIQLLMKPDARILEIGGGQSRILAHFENEFECWNLDKLEGAGNGPTERDGHHYKLVRNYIGDFCSELPDNYFDFVFSISVLEHVSEDDEALFENIVKDIARVSKKGAYSFHLFDIVFRNNTVWINKLATYMFAHLNTVNQLPSFEELQNDTDIYTMSKATYDKNWKRYIGKAYEEFGAPANLSVLWQNN